MSTARTYEDAITALNSLTSNFQTLEAIRLAGNPRMSDHAIPEMIEYLERIGYSTEDLNKLNVIHVTGTKGKGSTCAITDSVLRHAAPHLKVGLYTSPHLIAVRERIRINGAPLSEEDFARFFFEVWDRLEKNDTRKNPQTNPKPMYFRFVTLVAYHAFLSLKVDATVLEVGVGGTFDCTNIVPKPVVTGITSLGLDHTAVLGKTLTDIAWHKGGIFKEGVPALTVPQPEEGMDSLKSRAEELKASSFTVIVPDIPELADIKIGLPGKHQLQNAALAVNLAHTFLDRHEHPTILPPPSHPTNVPPHSLPSPLPPSYIQGLRAARWPGRCQQVSDPNYQGTQWFLDGAHTVESLTSCAEWFMSPGVALVPQRPDVRVLIFNCTNGRSGTAFLGTLLSVFEERLKAASVVEKSTEVFDHVMFCTNVTYVDGSFKGDLTSKVIQTDDEQALLAGQRELASAWSKLVGPSFPSSHIHVLPSIEHAVRAVRGIAERKEGGETTVDVLVTGSLHLVGGLIDVAGLAEVALEVGGTKATTTYV